MDGGVAPVLHCKLLIDGEGSFACHVQGRGLEVDVVRGEERLHGKAK